MKIELDILRSNYGKILNTSKFKFGKILIFGIPILAIIIIDVYNLNINLIIFGLVYLGLSFFLSSLLQKSNKQILEEITTQKIGTIKLIDDKIEVLFYDEVNFPKVNNIHQISEININSYFGEITGFGRTRELHYGTDTSIKFELNEKVKKYYVFIRDKEDMIKLKCISSYCLKLNTNYKEYTKSERTYNGKKLNYIEIQKLKKTISNNGYNDHISLRTL